MVAKSWTRAKTAVALLCLATAGLVAALEGALRLYDVLSGEIASGELLSRLQPHVTIAHPYLEYTWRRSFEGEVHFIEPGKTFRVRTNGFGFRTHEFYPKTGPEFRILVLGDSFTFGYNANQDETYGAVLERMLQERVSNSIRVYALGVPSYSGVRYAALARLYFDLLRPDMVIVAVDASDFGEDLERISTYVLDRDGAPVMLRRGVEFTPDDNVSFTIDASGRLTAAGVPPPDLSTRLQLGSSLYRHLHDALSRFRAALEQRRCASIAEDAASGRIPVVTYEELTRRYGAADISAGIPERLLVDTMPFSVERALPAYAATLNSLRYVKRQADRVGAKLYLSSYPYPWLVSTSEAIPYQVLAFGRIFDLRGDRAQPQLMDRFAAALGVPHLNSFPFFEKNAAGSYGQLDPHFNARGYARYAQFLYDSIEPDVRAAVR